MSSMVGFSPNTPASSQTPLENLIWHAETHKNVYNIPSDIDLVIVNSPTSNLISDNINYVLDTVKSTITSSTQVILFWGVEHNLVLDSRMVETLNQFCDSIPNPVLLTSGILGNWGKQWEGNLRFTLSPLLYFDYESATQWANNITLSDMRTKKFTSMGTKDYPNRKFLLSRMFENNLQDQGYVSYSQMASGNLIKAFYSPEDIEYINTIADRMDAHLPLPLLDANPFAWTKMPREFLSNSYLNMINDTYYEVENATFISEKVFNAMVHQQMFIMLSPAGTLEYLRSQGYQTFANVIDEGYDTITNNRARLEAVTKTFIDFVSKPIEEIRTIYQECLPILEHNRNRVYSKPLPDRLLAEINRAQYEKHNDKYYV